MTEHFDSDQVAFRTGNALLLDLIVDPFYLTKIQLSCQNNNIGKLAVKLQRLHVGNIKLRGKVNFYPFCLQYIITAASEAITADILASFAASTICLISGKSSS